MGEQNEGERGNMSGVNSISFIPCVFIRLYTAVHEELHTEQHLPLDLFELFNIKTLVPAYVNEHLHASVELEQGLRSWRRRMRSEQRRKVEHDGCGQLN